MVNKCLTIFLFLTNFISMCGEEFCYEKLSVVSYRCTKEPMRYIKIVNDIPDLVDALPHETEEFQESIYDTLEVELSGAPSDKAHSVVTIEPGQEVRVPLEDEYFTVTVKSKKSFLEHIDSIPKKVKSIIHKVPSPMITYFGFRCHVGSDVTVVHLGVPVLYGCHALKKKHPRTFSYKWPRGIQIWLKEPIDCD